MSDTGNTVLKEDGIFMSCTVRQSFCGYACCKFNAGNWIMLLPGEYDLAVQQGLKCSHLSFENNRSAICHSPCRSGDLKPIDCSWYPLFPANREATKFLVADHRKCPIPNHELINKMLATRVSALAWEDRHPGSLEEIITLSRHFVGYMPFPYKIENGTVVDMTEHEMREIALPDGFPEDYFCKEWVMFKPGYSAKKTPEDEN